MDKDPLDVLCLAEKEAQLWQLAQFKLNTKNNGSMGSEKQIWVQNISHDNLFWFSLFCGRILERKR